MLYNSYDNAKSAVNQGFFELDVKKMSRTNEKIFNYLTYFLLREGKIRISNGRLAQLLQVSVRSIIRFFKQYKCFFVRTGRFAEKAQVKWQLSNETRFQEWVTKPEHITRLARFIKAIRRFPHLLIVAVVSLQLLASMPKTQQPTGLKQDLSHHCKSNAFFNHAAAKATACTITISKHVSGGSAEGGERQFTQPTFAHFTSHLPQKRTETMSALPPNIQFTKDQQLDWLATPEHIQKAALQRLQLAEKKLGSQLSNKASYLHKTSQALFAQQKEKQPQQATRQERTAPSVEQRAREKASYHTLQELDDKITGLERYLRIPTIDPKARPFFEQTLESLRLAKIYRLQTEQPQPKKEEPKQPITPAQLEIAQYLAKIMPESAKRDALIAKANGDPLTKNNHVLDYILAEYLKHNSKDFK